MDYNEVHLYILKVFQSSLRLTIYSALTLRRVSQIDYISIFVLFPTFLNYSTLAGNLNLKLVATNGRKLKMRISIQQLFSSYRRTSLYAVFLSANSRICDLEIWTKIHYMRYFTSTYLAYMRFFCFNNKFLKF
jgi:hypothetical protein